MRAAEADRRGDAIPWLDGCSRSRSTKYKCFNDWHLLHMANTIRCTKDPPHSFCPILLFFVRSPTGRNRRRLHRGNTPAGPRTRIDKNPIGFPACGLFTPPSQEGERAAPARTVSAAPKFLSAAAGRHRHPPASRMRKGAVVTRGWGPAPPRVRGVFVRKLRREGLPWTLAEGTLVYQSTWYHTPTVHVHTHNASDPNVANVS